MQSEQGTNLWPIFGMDMWTFPTCSLADHPLRERQLILQPGASVDLYRLC
jgi:hypothetical protein